MDLNQILIYLIFGSFALLVVLFIGYGTYLLTHPTSTEKLTSQQNSSYTNPNGFLNRPTFWVSMLIAVGVLCALVIFPWIDRANDNTVSPAGRISTTKHAPIQQSTFNPSHRITYRVTGSAEAITVTYTTNLASMEQYNTNIPFTREFTFQIYTYASILAQKLGQDGDITCEILDDGRVWRTSTSAAHFALVTCAGIIGQ